MVVAFLKQQLLQTKPNPSRVLADSIGEQAKMQKYYQVQNGGAGWDGIFLWGTVQWGDLVMVSVPSPTGQWSVSQIAKYNFTRFLLKVVWLS